MDAFKVRFLCARGRRTLMADIVSPEKRSQNMSAIRSKNTKPEVYLRKLLFAQGYRYRIAYTPKSRVEFWQKKFDDNVRRDSAVKAELLVHGIKCLIVWECTIKRMVKSSDVEKQIIQQCTSFLRTEAKRLEL